MSGLRVISSLAIAMLAGMLLLSWEKADERRVPSKAFPVLSQNIQPAPMPERLDFAGEAVRLGHVDIRERVERELNSNCYRHGATMDFLRRSTRYFPMIEDILQQEGIPDDFKYLAVAESSLRNAVSPAGAKGFWQFLRGTGIEQGLKITSQVDERYHVERATRAACKYIRSLKERFGTWTLAAAAYNMGPNGLEKEVNHQREKRYFDLNLIRETLRYVPRILAFKMIHQDPAKFGFNLDADDFYPPHEDLRTVEINVTQLSLAELAHDYGATYRELKYYNPWLLSNELHVKRGDVYYVKLPRRG